MDELQDAFARHQPVRDKVLGSANAQEVAGAIQKMPDAGKASVLSDGLSGLSDGHKASVLSGGLSGLSDEGADAAGADLTDEALAKMERMVAAAKARRSGNPPAAPPS